PHEGEALIIAPWPEADPLDEAAEEEMTPIMEMIRAIRNARAEYEVEPTRAIAATIVAGQRRELLLSQKDILIRLARIDAAQLRIEQELAEKPTKALVVVVGGYEVFLPWAGLVDIERERARLAGELENLQKEIARAEKLLANPNFHSKAPMEVVNKEQTKLEEYRQRYAKLEERLRSLS
ncbi:MAG: valine--tRNA ligase, partial [Chloroflexi bacterium]|nr:valine--tRNA ligase [Chloroflexota bacterium]